MTDNNERFNFRRSALRMDSLLGQSDNGYTDRERIPAASSLNYTNGFYVTCAVFCIDIRGSSSLPSLHTKPVLAKIYRTYISEIVALVKSSPLHRHIRIIGDAVMGIFDVPVPSQNLSDLLVLAARASSLIKILNTKLEKKGYTPLRVGIGLSFGRVLMIQAGFVTSGHNEIIWMGDAINSASKLSNLGNKTAEDGQIMISNDFYQKLKREYKDLVTLSPHGCYTGDLVNPPMEKFLGEMKKPKPKPSPGLMGMGPTLPTPLPPPASSFLSLGLSPGLFGLSSLSDPPIKPSISSALGSLAAFTPNVPDSRPKGLGDIGDIFASYYEPHKEETILGALFTRLEDKK